MPGFFYVLSRWWKQVFGLVLLSLGIATIICLLQPKEYLSVATSLPANSYSADRSRLFNENIQSLYSSMGSSNELDMMEGTGQLDTIYLAISDQFDLPSHYKLSKSNYNTRYKSAKTLRKNSRVMKSAYGELKVKVWDKDKHLAAHLANAITDKIQQIHSDLQNSNNISTLNNLREGQNKINQRLRDLRSDSTTDVMVHEEKLKAELIGYEKMISEYQLMADSKPLALLVVEQARAATKPDKPQMVQLLLVTAVISFLFGILTALILEQRKTTMA